jgi:hypothetical protein
MRHFARLVATLGLAAVLSAAGSGGIAARGQASGGHPSEPAPGGKNPVQGYTRANRKTGQPVQVRPYDRRPPPSKGVEVRSYERKGKPVKGHQRRKPGADKPPRSARRAIRSERMA